MRLRGGGPSEEEKEEEAQLVAAEEVRSPAPKRTQYGLQRFFGTPEQKATAQPVLTRERLRVELSWRQRLPERST